MGAKEAQIHKFTHLFTYLLALAEPTGNREWKMLNHDNIRDAACNLSGDRICRASSPAQSLSLGDRGMIAACHRHHCATL
jgi:hypothetical protein